MRPSQDEKLVEARQYFYSYQFRQAYHLYRLAFSTLPFQISPAQLDHISHYARTLLEMDKLDELRFYLPILERQYEKAPAALLGYALGYIHYFLGSKVRGQRLFEAVRDGAGEDADLRIKAVMMLARLASSEGDCIRAIQSIEVPARDPQLAKLVEVWRCIVLRYQGRTPDSIARLRVLMEGIDHQLEWYCLLAAKDALVRGQLHGMDFDGARSEIEGLGANAAWGKFRTVVMQIEQLDAVYQDHLSRRTIVGVEKKSGVELTHGGVSIRVHQPVLCKLIHLFSATPSLTIRKATNQLSVPSEQLREIVRRFAQRLGELQLPMDSVHFQGIRVQLVPALRMSAAASGGRPWKV